MTSTQAPNFRPRTYLTGVRYSPMASWLQDWVVGAIETMPTTSYYATPEQTQEVAAQLTALGYHVELVTR